MSLREAVEAIKVRKHNSTARLLKLEGHNLIKDRKHNIFIQAADYDLATF